MLLRREDEARWRRLAHKGAAIWLSDGAQLGADEQHWYARSTRGPHIYDVCLRCSREGVDVRCTCIAGRYDSPCRHAAMVLLVNQLLALETARQAA